MRKELAPKEENELKSLSVEELQEKLSELSLKQKVLIEQKRDLVKGYNELLKKVKCDIGDVLEVLEAKDSDTARKVLVEINRK